MNVYQHFSCYTRLPILLEDIRAQILDVKPKVVDSIDIYSASLNPQIVEGFMRVFDQGGTKKAHIFCSNKLDQYEDRVVICKEMLHVADEDGDTAKTRDMVSRLITEVVAPLSLTASIPGRSDHLGILHALVILMPRDAINEIKPHFAAGRLNIEAIANLAAIPQVYIPFIMSDVWEGVVESII